MISSVNTGVSEVRAAWKNYNPGSLRPSEGGGDKDSEGGWGWGGPLPQLQLFAEVRSL